MLDAPALELPSSSLISYTLRDVPRRHRFAVMRDKMADGHPPFMRALLTATREDDEAPFERGIQAPTTREVSCVETFFPTGVSCARHVLRRRLQECHAMLASPAHAYRSVTDIAFAGGFNSLTTFYSAFQREFGMAPGKVRRAAGSGDVAPSERPHRIHRETASPNRCLAGARRSTESHADAAAHEAVVTAGLRCAGAADPATAW